MDQSEVVQLNLRILYDRERVTRVGELWWRCDRKQDTIMLIEIRNRLPIVIIGHHLPSLIVRAVDEWEGGGWKLVGVVDDDGFTRQAKQNNSARSCMHSTLRRAVLNVPKRYASTLDGASTMGPFRVFDRDMKRMQRDRAAVVDNGDRSRTVDYLRDEVADRLVERFAVSFNA